MSATTNTPATRLATRLSFLVSGFVMAAWAPLVPFAKQATGVGEGTLGLLLLCLGLGSIVAMPVTGWISAQRGARPMILLGGVGLCLALPLAAAAATPLALGAALFLLGASLGTMDVAMNVHAVEVERESDRPLMSGFHAMFSVGGFLGAGSLTALLSQGVGAVAGAVAVSVAGALAMLVAAPRLLRVRAGDPPAFALPRGIVLALAGLSAILFLVEGAVLDWGALLIIGRGMMPAEQAGLGYMAFAIAMTVGRLTGDRIVARLGAFLVLLWGGIVAVAGIAVILLAPGSGTMLAGFVLIGLGASNLVPVLFSLSGRQRVMAPGLAIAAVTTTGYAGILVGPAAVGAVSHLSSLPIAFWLLAVLTALVPLSARSLLRAL